MAFRDVSVCYIGKSQTFSQSYGRKRKRNMSSSDEIVSSSADSERMCKTLCKEHPGGSKQPDHGREKQKRSLKEQEISDKYADRKIDNHELHLTGSRGKDRDWRSLCKSEISECRKGKNKKRKIHETSSSESSGSNDSDSSFDGKHFPCGVVKVTIHRIIKCGRVFLSSEVFNEW